MSGFVLTCKGFIVSIMDGQTDPDSKSGKLLGFLDQDYYDTHFKHKDDAECKAFIMSELERLISYF